MTGSALNGVLVPSVFGPRQLSGDAVARIRLAKQSKLQHRSNQILLNDEDQVLLVHRTRGGAKYAIVKMTSSPLHPIAIY